MTFSNLNFASPSTSDLQRTSSKRPHSNTNDPRTALAALEKKEEILANLDPEKREKAIEKGLWKKAELLAQGEKVRDDPKLLKK